MGLTTSLIVSEGRIGSNNIEKVISRSHPENCATEGPVSPGFRIEDSGAMYQLVLEAWKIAPGHYNPMILSDRDPSGEKGSSD